MTYICLIDYRNDTNQRSKSNQSYYEVYEIEVQEDCPELYDQQSYVDFNNRRDITYRLTDDLNQWSPNVNIYCLLFSHKSLQFFTQMTESLKFSSLYSDFKLFESYRVVLSDRISSET